MAKNPNDVKRITNQSLLQQTGKTQAAFVPKLFIMVEDMREPTQQVPHPERPLISWSKTGDVFCVFDPIEFSRVILPLHFKHNNWQSFVRQLNMYGFHKVNDLLTSSQCHPETSQAWEFRHPYFKRDRADLLPMIKRKSTKNHASSKATTTAQVKAQASLRAGESRFHQHIQPSENIPARAARLVLTPHDHPGSALLSDHHPLHGKPPTPPPLHISKMNAMPHLPPRPPSLHPLLTHIHQVQYPNPSPRRIKPFPPPLKPESIQGSTSTATTSTNNSSVLSSPRSMKPCPHNTHPLTGQPPQPQPCSIEQEKFGTGSYFDTWRGKPESHREDSVLSRVEDELRRLTDALSHHDLTANHTISVLGLLVDLVTLLVRSNEDKNPPDQHHTLFTYVHAAKDVMTKLEDSRHEFRCAGRKCSCTPSTNSISPVSSNLPERPSTLPTGDAIDSNYFDKNGQPASPSHDVRPLYAHRASSSQSLPPLRTIVENWAPPISNRTWSSGPLPLSINRLMNEDPHEHRTAQITPYSDQDPNELRADEDHDELTHGDCDDLVEDDDIDRHPEEGHDQIRMDETSDDDEGGDNDDSWKEESPGLSANGHQSAGYHPKDASESPIGKFACPPGVGFQHEYQTDRSTLVPVERPSAELRSILCLTKQSARELTPQDINLIHKSRKRTRIS